MKIPGTKAYTAPEILMHGRDLLSQAADIWAVGCIGYELFSGVHLFETEHMIDHFAKTGLMDPTRLALPQPSEDILRVISGCLRINPGSRVSALQLLDLIQRAKPPLHQPY